MLCIDSFFLQHRSLFSVELHHCTDSIFIDTNFVHIATQTIFYHDLSKGFPVFHAFQNIQLFCSKDACHKLAAQKNLSKASAFFSNGSDYCKGMTERLPALFDHPGCFYGTDDSRNPVKRTGTTHRVKMGSGHETRHIRLPAFQSSKHISHLIFFCNQTDFIHLLSDIVHTPAIGFGIALSLNTSFTWFGNRIKGLYHFL